ncbi:MAG: hypothetical protein HFI66_05620 [Lachnospiraceae bacterium]|nr:hypothetical protein [Lachnospiraceae bacterium]
MSSRDQGKKMPDRNHRRRARYILAGLGLLLVLLFISSLGMWLVREFLEHYDGKKYGEAVAVADTMWQQSEPVSEAALPSTANVEAATEEELQDTVLLDGNRLNDMERLQVLAELSLKYYGSFYGQYLDREPIEEIEVSEEEAREMALRFLDTVNASLPSGSMGYQVEGEVNMSFRADKEHPSAALWVADFTTHGCIMFLYLDSKTGLPIRFRAAYNPYAVSDFTDAVYENGMALDVLATTRNWQTGNPAFLEDLFSYLSEYLRTNFYINPVFSNFYPETDDSGNVFFLPISQWMTDDYRYVLTWAFRNRGEAEGYWSYFDLVLSPMETQETIRKTFSDEYGYWIITGKTDG